MLVENEMERPATNAARKLVEVIVAGGIDKMHVIFNPDIVPGGNVWTVRVDRRPATQRELEGHYYDEPGRSYGTGPVDVAEVNRMLREQRKEGHTA